MNQHTLDEHTQHRLDFVRDYSGVTGLGMAVTGVGLALISTGQEITGWATFLTGIPLSTAYYRRHHGEVTERADPVRSAVATTVVVVFLGLLTWMRLEGIGHGRFAPEVFLGAGFLSAILAVTHQHVGVHPVQWLVCAGLAVVGLLPLAGVPVDFPRSTIALGVACVAIGAVDHVRLMCAFRLPQEGDDAQH